MNILKSFLRPGIIMALPPGQQGVDPKGGAGLLQAFMAAVNAHGMDGMQSYATTGNVVNLVGNDILNGIVQLNTGATAGITLNLPTTQNILASLGPAVAQDGSFTAIIGIINNNSGQTATLTAGDTPTSVQGTATIATNVTRLYAMRVMQSALIFTNIGSMTL